MRMRIEAFLALSKRLNRNLMHPFRQTLRHPNTLALAYAGLEEKAKAIEQAPRSVKDYDTDGVNKPWALTTLAQIQARFGDHGAAIAALPRLREVPAGITVANLKLDPLWDPLREDPRFQKTSPEGVPGCSH